MHPPRIFVLGTILGVLMSACSPAPSPAPTPTSVPSVPTCVPEFEGTPFPCTQAEFEANQKMLARYAEAERVYREFIALNATEYAERRPEPSPELIALTGGKYRDGLPEVRSAALDAASYEGSLQVGWARRVPHEAGRPGNVSMVTCLDFSGWTVTPTQGPPTATVPRPARVDFDDATGSMIVVDIRPVGDGTCE